MDLYKTVRDISFIFFFVLGLGHFTSGLLFVNGYGGELSALINRILFIPFLIAVITLLYSKAKIGDQEKKISSTLAPTILIVGGAIVIAIIALEFLFPDSTNPLRSL